MAEFRAAYAKYAQDLDDAGVLISADILKPTSASTTVTLRTGSLQIQDGPFADTKEQLGGIVIIDVPDLDSALEWARQAPPASWGTVEVRPGAVHIEAGAWVPSS